MICRDELMSQRILSKRAVAGFTLIELMLAISLGGVFFGVLMRLIGADLRLGSAMASSLRKSALRRRTLELIRDELAVASSWTLDSTLSRVASCPIAGRRPVLVIGLDHGGMNPFTTSVVYSVGAAPSPIWRGHVLMRCGPAYGLDGAIRPEGLAQNRVLIDGLPKDGMGFHAHQDPQSRVLHLQLEQVMSGSSDRHRSAAVF